jgi:alpha-L-rhamnosidase
MRGSCRLGIGLQCVVFLGIGGSVETVAAAELKAEPFVSELRQRFAKPPDDSRILMRWWWFGSAVTKPEIERELRVMKEGGIGGVEIQPVYPLALDDPAAGVQNLPFLSEAFLDALRFTSVKARELGLRMDLTLGSGWPFGGPTVTVAEAAGKLRIERVLVPGDATRVAVPDVSAGEKLLAVFVGQLQGDALDAPRLREVTDVTSGVVRLPARLGSPHEVLFFISSRTGMQVKRPAVGGEGFVLDHYDRTAVDHYLRNVGDRLLQPLYGNLPYAIFCDSLEVFGSNWTADFMEEFQRRRGYDLRPHLPALAADVGPKTTGVRRDWGKTLTELLDERFMAPVHEWARTKSTRFRMQAYGSPPATLSSNAHVDLSEGEGWQWKTMTATRWASSANHVFGRPVTSSETWTWLHSPSFRATPLDMKAEADLHFLQGVNQLVGHGWPYTAPGTPYPGSRFYAAAAFDETNPWWTVMPDVSLYLQRLSFLLRQGQPVNDVAVYLPNDDAWPVFVSGGVRYMIEALGERLGKDIVTRVLDAGFGFDFVDGDVIDRLGRIESGALVVGSNRYRAVVLPGVERIPLGTYRKLEVFARNGGALIATRRAPEGAPGFLATDAENNEVRALSKRLFETAAAPGRLAEDETTLSVVLNRELRPDLRLSPAVPEIGFVHRETADVDLYFLANTSNRSQRTNATFRVGGGPAEWWDPLTGTIRRATTHAQPEGGTSLDLELPPYGSRVLVFAKGVPDAPAARAPRRLAAPLDLSQGWTVAFGPDRPPVVMETLRSWADDPATRYFSGVATYERTVDVPGGMLEGGSAVSLDLGEATALEPQGVRFQAWLDGPVREAAVVYVNGHRAGSVWCPPYSLDVKAFLRAGENTLRIEVANVATNQMAGQSQPDYRLLNLRYGVRFEAQDMDKVQPVPSGLRGPIRLVPRDLSP